MLPITIDTAAQKPSTRGGVLVMFLAILSAAGLPSSHRSGRCPDRVQPLPRRSGRMPGAVRKMPVQLEREKNAMTVRTSDNRPGLALISPESLRDHRRDEASLEFALPRTQNPERRHKLLQLTFIQ